MISKDSYLPFLCIGRALCERQFQPIVFIFQLRLSTERWVWGGTLVHHLLWAVVAQVQLGLQQVRVHRIVLVLMREVLRLHIVIVLVRPTRDRGGVGRGGRSRSRPSSVRFPTSCSRGRLLYFRKLLNELVQLSFRSKAKAVDSICSDVAPLAKLLARLCERHVGSDRGVDDGFGAFHGDDSVESSGGVVEEGDGDRGVRGGDPGALGLGVDVEDMRLASEDRLLT